MRENRNATAIAIDAEQDRALNAAVLHSAGTVLGRTGTWAAETAQKFGALLSALMGPAIFSAYAFAFWSLAGNLGWTDTFVFPRGPLSNWLIWLGFAILINLATTILRRHTQAEEAR